MNCQICDEILNTLESPQCQIDGNNYCLGCADVSSFADMIKTPSILKVSENIKENKKVSVAPSLKKSTITYKCIKCHLQTSGNNCEHCGMLSPLMAPKPKKKK